MLGIMVHNLQSSVAWASMKARPTTLELHQLPIEVLILTRYVIRNSELV